MDILMWIIAPVKWKGSKDCGSKEVKTELLAL